MTLLLSFLFVYYTDNKTDSNRIALIWIQWRYKILYQIVIRLMLTLLLYSTNINSQSAMFEFSIAPKYKFRYFEIIIFIVNNYLNLEQCALFPSEL